MYPKLCIYLTYVVGIIAFLAVTGAEEAQWSDYFNKNWLSRQLMLQLGDRKCNTGKSKGKVQQKHS